MNNRGIFVDSEAFLARFNPKDQYHSQALEVWRSLAESESATCTTNHVLDELATLLARRTSYHFSFLKLTDIYNSEIHIDRPGPQDEKEALILFEKYADQEVTFTDCLSFAP